ncbi:proton-coupled folate transporter-like [Diadema antillarum]|uniref:proton-coupled folate transporter-like n=1 Tax=Diadema antillarum TaxID=105358 RepID=UPI003A8BB6CC
MANHDSDVHVRKTVGGAVHNSSELLPDNTSTPTERLIDNSKDSGEAVAKCGLERAKSRFMTIELPVTLACFSYRLLVTLEAEYIHARVAADYNFSLNLNASQSTCDADGNLNGSSANVNEEVQSVTSLWLLYLGLAMFIPNLFTALWFGSMGDRAGRKPALFVPVLGFWCQSIVYFAIVRFQLPLYVFIAGDFISGFCGSTALTLSTAAAYITDVTSVKSRTFRVVVLETVAFVGSALGQISLGLLLQYGSGGGEGSRQYKVFLTPLILAFATSSASLIYIIFPRALIETVDRRTATGRSLFSGVVSMFRVNINRRRYKLVLYMAVMVCVTISSASLSNLVVIYSIGAPYCFTPLQVSVLQVTLYIVSALGMIVGGAILPRLMRENWVLQLSIWNTLLVYVIIGFARSQAGLFVGVTVAVLCALCFPLVRSQLSKLAEPNERGLMLATAGCMNSAAYIITPLMSQYVYSATVFFYSPFVFFFQAAFLFLPSLATGVLQRLERRPASQILMDNDSVNNH